METPEKFVCLKCADCCKDFGNNFKNRIPSISGNCIWYSKPRLPLWDWEIHHFPKESIVPMVMLFDLKNEKSIIYQYTLNLQPCPMLNKKNRCLIYKDRPIVCKYFPCPIGDTENQEETLDVQLKCRAEKNVFELSSMLGMKLLKGSFVTCDSTSELSKNLYKRYGIAYVYRFSESILRTEIIGRFLFDLEQKGICKFAKEGYNINRLMKRIEKSEKINISDIFNKYNKDKLKDFLSKENIKTCEDGFNNKIK